MAGMLLGGRLTPFKLSQILLNPWHGTRLSFCAQLRQTSNCTSPNPVLSSRPASRQSASQMNRVIRRTSLLSRVAGRRLLSTDSITFNNILVSSPQDGVGLITLNRPTALNGMSSLSLLLVQVILLNICAIHAALNSQTFTEINSALESFTTDTTVRAVVITGSKKAFAAGADIKEMKDKEFAEAYREDFLVHWTKMSSFRKPIVAAVSGYALGGGCELAMM